MKWLYVFVAIFLALVNAEENTCSADMNEHCVDPKEQFPPCNATFSGFPSGIHHLQAYANEQLVKSFDYLTVSASFGSYVKNRAGFEKQFRALSDTAWQRSINLMKHITKRGGEHNFKIRYNTSESLDAKKTLNLNEIESLAFALSTEIGLAKEAHLLHERYSHANKEMKYDPEIAHYLEENFIEDQATTIRKFSGYTNDLMKLLSGNEVSLSLYMFDEYLQKQ